MRIPTSLVLTAVAGSLGLATIGGSAVLAANGNGNTPRADHQSSLVSAIATKFNLNQADVQAVFDAQRAQFQAEHQAQFEAKLNERLAQAVTNGKLTQAQADTIKAKIQSEKTFMETLKDKTPEERRDAMKSHMTELQQWAKDNNIPTQYLMQGFGGPENPRAGMGKGNGKGHAFGQFRTGGRK